MEISKVLMSKNHSTLNQMQLPSVIYKVGMISSHMGNDVDIFPAFKMTMQNASFAFTTLKRGLYPEYYL